MTSQRDRLAKALIETCDYDEALGGCGENHYDTADALIARGVRVVDVETLDSALNGAYSPTLKMPAGYFRQAATAILAALDAEAAS